ncbi:nanos 3-like protein [Dinothrombium tinctorium]|uniref:Nanos 3-like protein n=1 Tax=Dinothrombium tinctorium TaxID=1965070 RepID=A0A3S3PJM8_9ACAR|nr:nanos 3-like protein [Dinothrombium tinctorium]RWS14251.1 nanos 3-like protein [Dinothrombium tinctorium]RWS16570.1 nanos 3-like protein [Dinothrombium tinctorium]RWS16595.1 nanos 3-like protein [Dinothrombium tinctorium]
MRIIRGRGVCYPLDLPLSAGQNASDLQPSLPQTNDEELEQRITRLHLNHEKKRKARDKRVDECSFCKQNGEPRKFYTNHTLRGRDGKILCPILRRYNCPICHNGGGDNAHTIRYCPKNVGPSKVESIMKKIKQGRKSNGRK